MTRDMITGVRWNAMKRDVSKDGAVANGLLVAFAKKPIPALKVMIPPQCPRRRWKMRIPLLPTRRLMLHKAWASRRVLLRLTFWVVGPKIGNGMRVGNGKRKESAPSAPSKGPSVPNRGARPCVFRISPLNRIPPTQWRSFDLRKRLVPPVRIVRNVSGHPPRTTDLPQPSRAYTKFPPPRAKSRPPSLAPK